MKKERLPSEVLELAAFPLFLGLMTYLNTTGLSTLRKRDGSGGWI